MLGCQTGSAARTRPGDAGRGEEDEWDGEEDVNEYECWDGDDDEWGEEDELAGCD